MKIECNQPKIKDAVSYAERIASKQTSLPILSCVLLDGGKENLLHIKATNLDMALEMSVPAKISEVGAIAVSASVLNSFMTNISVDKGVFLETTEGNLKIKTSNGSTIIKTQAHEDFPSIPRVEGGTIFSLNTTDFIKGLKSVWYSSSISGIKPELSSIYIYCEDEFVVFVSTDSFRLAEKKIKLKKSKDFGQILIPFKNIPEIIKILEPINDEIEVSLNKNQISFSYKGLYLTSRVVDGTFPDYRQIIPKTTSTEIIVLKQDMMNALKISNIFSDKFNQVNIKADPSKKQCEIKTKNNDVGESVTNLDSVITGEPVDMNFNYKYIVDSFQSIDSDSLTLVFSGQNKPLVITPVSDNSFRYLVMPMNR